jgi:SAM-dependent methyltransferase
METQSMNLGNCCLICSSKKIHYDFSIEKFRVEECSDCGIMRLNPQPSDQELAKIYSENYFLTSDDDAEGQSHVSALKSSTAERYLNLLENYAGAPLKGTLLEIGCGYGDFLAKAAEKGLTVTGVEYSSHATKIAADKLGNRGEVITGEISQLLQQTKRYDYIVFADVLEHVRNPREFLQQAYSLLNENGIAVAIVPSTDSLSARLMNNKWMEFKPEHLWYFSRSTLRRLFYSENFERSKVHLAKKTLSLEYIIQHFERYPVQPFTGALRLIKGLLPRFVRKHPIGVDAGGIMMMAKKAPIKIRKKLSIVMAAYNEEKTIQSVIDRVLAKEIADLDIELIIVESKSTDKTREILQQYEGRERVKLIYQEHPRGKGNAIREGLEHISGDFVLIQDADDEYDLEDYDSLLDPLMMGEASFVLGARHGGRAWKMRQFSDQRITGHILNLGHWCFTLLVNVLFGLKLKDPFTMYKVFRADCLHGIKFECDRFDFDYELLIKLVRNGYRPIEIPVNYRSRSFTEGKKIRVIRDPITWLRAIIKFRLQKA